jgi:4-hydroxy-2-oxoheptanedioate aldolase
MSAFRPNRARQKLDAGGVVTLVMGDFSPDMVEFLGHLGFDAVLGEMEHGTTSWRDVADISRACDLWDMMAMVRVNRNEPGLIGRALDCGANGVMVPHVNTADEARQVAHAARFGPLGARGQFGGRRAFGVPDYHRQANENVVVSILLEDIVAIRNLSEIVRVDGIDVFYVAPGDLAQSMGHTGDIAHQEVQRVIDDAHDLIIKSGRVAGALVTDDTIERTLARGVRFVGVSWLNWLTVGAQGFLSKIPPAVRGA